MNDTLENPSVQNTVIFHTSTDIDPISWEIMGIHAKPNGKNPIGLFGTGLKYAIAVLLRTGHEITIYNGEKKYEFTLEPMQFRGVDFDRITCNGKTLPFTTDYGKNWKVCGAYRELTSNTMDEGGLHYAGDIVGDDGTYIVVKGKEFRQCLENHLQYFVGDREPIHEGPALRIFNGSGNVFFRGVKVAEVQNAHYDYEILNEVELTEDRTIANAYMIRFRVGQAVCAEVKNKELLTDLVTKRGFEGELDYDNPWSEDIKNVVSEVWSHNPQLLNKELIAKHKAYNPTAGFKVMEMDEEQRGMLRRSMEFLETAGYPVTARVQMVDNGDANLLAFYHGDEIHLSVRAFEKTSFDLAQILFEEQHHRNGHDDYSHGFQRYLIEQVMIQAKKRTKFVF